MTNSIHISRRLPLLLITNNVLLPGASMRIPVRKLCNVNLVRNRLLGRNTLNSSMIGVVPQDPASDELDDDSSTGLHSIGTAAVVVQVTGTNWPQSSYTLLVTGLCRIKIDDLLQETPYLIAKVTQLDKITTDNVEELSTDGELKSLAEQFREQASLLVDMLDVSIPMVAKLKKMLSNVPVQHLPDICSSIVKATYTEKLQVLDAVDISERFKKTLPLLMRQIEDLKLLQKSRKATLTISRKQSERKKLMRTEDDDDIEDVDDSRELAKKILAAKLPPDAERVAVKELKRLRKMPQQTPEHAMIRNYLELIAELPWTKSTQDTIDITKARTDLDADHYGLDKLKRRVIEYLAVRRLKNNLKGPILCFVGPPGVGKTSVGKSIAKTLGRHFHRIALGGVCDQSDIRGHRRTYIGAMPGRIINGLKVVGTKNPVFLLDEIDKMSSSLHGDPAAALLEVLDPEQNHTFVDQMEVINVAGYSQEEKLRIAQQHLVSKQLLENGLDEKQLNIEEEAIAFIISHYTREAGVRSLERKLGAVCRAVAVRIAENSDNVKDLAENDMNELKRDGVTVDVNNVSRLKLPLSLPITVDRQTVEDILGPTIYESEVRERLSEAGVAIGLAWTNVGGEIMYVEATLIPGTGKLTLTGQLGDVMKESANLALNWVRSHITQIGCNEELLEQNDVHIHFPAGAISKDGPSAGVTIVTVLVSLLTGRCVRPDTAMTGEVTLRGLVLPVGGVKEKVLAAHRSGIHRVILPQRNNKDLHELPANVKDKMTFLYATTVADVLNEAFDGGIPLLTEISSALNSKL